MLPRISIVTPSYNQSSYLETTIRSVLEQNYPNLEYFIMDGGSSDGSVEIIQKYAKHLTYWQSQKDGGQSHAIREGFSRATGDVLFWIASDDFLLPGALDKVGRYFLSHPETEALSGGCLFVDAKGFPLKSRRSPSYTLGVPATYNRLRYYEQDGLAQPATFFRRSAYEAVGGIDPSFFFVMDLDLFLRLAKRRPFAQLPHILSGFRIHPDSKTSSCQQIRLKEQHYLLSLHCPETPLWKNRLFWWWYRIFSLIRKSRLLLVPPPIET